MWKDAQNSERKAPLGSLIPLKVVRIGKRSPEWWWLKEGKNPQK